jgi:hypothetical protein
LITVVVGVVVVGVVSVDVMVVVVGVVSVDVTVVVPVGVESVGVVVVVGVVSVVVSSQMNPARSNELLADHPAAPSARNRRQKSSGRI